MQMLLISLFDPSSTSSCCSHNVQAGKRGGDLSRGQMSSDRPPRSSCPKKGWGCWFSASNPDTEVHFSTWPGCVALTSWRPITAELHDDRRAAWRADILDSGVRERSRTLNLQRQRRVLVWSQAGNYMMNTTLCCLGRIKRETMRKQEGDDSNKAGLGFSCRKNNRWPAAVFYRNQQWLKMQSF